MGDELRQSINRTANNLGIAPEVLGTVISYETGGTFDPWKKGPTTQWGQHRGLIQWGEPQRARYGVHKGMSVSDQMVSVEAYLRDAGVEPGMGLLDVYSAVNAGSVGLYDRTDEDNGGAPGTVRNKVRYQMDGHKAKAMALLGGKISASNGSEADLGDFIPQYEAGGAPSALGSAFSATPISFEPVTSGEFPEGDPSWFQLMADAAQSQSTIATLSRINPQLQFDPNYQLTEDKLKEYLGDELDAEFYSPWFEAARSEAHALAIREAALLNKDRKSRLADAGLSGLALQFGAEMLDPVALAAETATLGLAVPATRGIKGGKIVQMGRAALLGSTAAAAGEAATVPIVPERDGWDIVEAGIYGAGLGAVAGALMRNPDLVEEGVKLRRMGQELSDELETRPATREGGSTVGAAQNVGSDDDFLEGTLGQIQDEEVPRTFAGWTRWIDITGWLRTSKNPVTRMLGGVLAKDAADPGVFTASEDMAMHFDGWTRDYFATLNPAMKSYLKEKGIKWHQRREIGKATGEFNDEVSRYVRDRRRGAGSRYNENVRRVGDKIRKVQKEIKDLAQNPWKIEGLEGRSVKGFEELADNPYYLMRVWDSGKVRDARKAYTDDGIRKAIEEGMRRAKPDVPRDIRRKAAKAFVRAVTRRSYNIEDEVMRKLGSEDLDEVIDVLHMEGGLSKADAESLVSHYRAKPGSDTPARGKQRLFMDETARLDLARKDGTGVDRVSIQDLLLANDANYLFGRYVRQMSGRIALSRVKVRDPKTGEIIQDGITSDGEFRKLVNAVKKRAADDGLSDAQTKNDVERLEFLGNYLTGRPVFDMDQTRWGEWARMIEKFNYARIGNQFGFAQLPEFSGILAVTGLKAMASHMPAFRRIVGKTGDLKFRDELFNDLEVFNAYGVDVLTRNDYQRFDDLMGSPFSADRGRFVDKAENVLNTASHVTSTISGMNLVNAAMQRMATAAVVQKFVDMAYKGKEFAKVRMRALGLDDAMTERIYKQLVRQENVETTTGFLTGKKIKRLNWDNWADMEAREAFRQTLFRMTRQAVQVNDIGMLSQWMNRPIVRLFAQFRRFVFGAFTNNLLYNLNMMKGGDMRAASFFLLSSLMSAASYSAWTYSKSIGRDDQDEYLEKRLNWGSIAKASFARSGYSSILPMLWDTGPSRMLTGGPTFDGFRTSGNPMDAVMGNPTVSIVDDAVSLGNAITHPLLNNRSLTAKEAQDAVRLLPFANALPIVIALNAMTSGLEDRPPREDFKAFQQ